MYTELLYFPVSRVPFGNVLGLAKERVRTWLSVVSLWPLVFCFGHKVHNLGQFFWSRTHLACCTYSVTLL